jgi:hypothetical protein
LQIFRRIYQGLGWALAAAWLYVHAFVFAANQLRPSADPYLRGPVEWIFRRALQVAFMATLPWLFGAIGLWLFLSWLRLRPTRYDVTVFLLILGLAAAYFALDFWD